MLNAALAAVALTGLTVSMEHISFEDIIRDADVSRSAAYRRWPYKDLFFADLLSEVARSASPGILDDRVTLEVIRSVVLEHLDWFETTELRSHLVYEVIRQVALIDFESICESREWRTYLALNAMFSSMADRDLQREWLVTLARTEEGLTTRVAGAWQMMSELFGYRLRPELNASFESFASVLIANQRGLVVMALSVPTVRAARFQASPLGSGDVGEWSLASLGVASIAYGFLEPDPNFVWHEQRRSQIERSLGVIFASYLL